MRVSIALAGAALLSLVATVPASAANPAPADATENGRYSMTPIDGGFLRLDTRNGMVSLCKIENGAAICRAATEERTALENEIDRLAKQNEALKKQQGPSVLPTRQEFDRALDYAEQFMRRMMRIMREDEPSKNKT